MTKFQEQYMVGTEISGTFSKLDFKGIVVAHIAECVIVEVENPHRNLPLGPRGLCCHPSDSNVTINEQEMSPALEETKIMQFAGTLNSEETMWGQLSDGRHIYVEMLTAYENAPESQRNNPEYWLNRYNQGDFDETVWIAA